MSIENLFTKEEFRRLLFLTFLGEWIMNAHKGPNSNTEYTEVLDKILGYPGVKLKDVVGFVD